MWRGSGARDHEGSFALPARGFSWWGSVSALTKEEALLQRQRSQEQTPHWTRFDELKLRAALAVLGHCASMVRMASARSPSSGPALVDLDAVSAVFCQTSLALGLLSEDLPPALGKRPLEDAR